MTHGDFDRLAARTRLNETSLRIARAVLIDGLSQAEAARREGLTRQRASDAVSRLLRELRAEGGFPPGWRVITVCVPESIAHDMIERAMAAQRKAGLRID